LVARRDDTLLILKVFQNVDALSRGTAQELKAIARTLEGSPLVVGERSGTGPLEDGVIYSRFGVPILCRSTLLEFLEEGVAPSLGWRDSSEYSSHASSASGTMSSRRRAVRSTPSQSERRRPS